MAPFHATIESDDNGVNCAYCDEHGWIPVEDSCATCGHALADCECDEEDCVIEHETGVCACLAALNLYDCSKCGQAHYAKDDTDICRRCWPAPEPVVEEAAEDPKPHEAPVFNDNIFHLFRVNGKLYAHYLEARKAAPVGARIATVNVSHEVWDWISKTQRKYKNARK
jgi:hypothetical protein